VVFHLSTIAMMHGPISIKNFIVFLILLGQHVSILIESSSGPSKIQILT